MSAVFRLDTFKSLKFQVLGPRGFTVNSVIFMRILFSRNLAYAKFPENKPSQNFKTTLSFTNVGKSCPKHEFLTWQICLLTLFAKINFS